jgi:molecular chaperone GrpE (heat shock protein)
MNDPATLIAELRIGVEALQAGVEALLARAQPTIQESEASAFAALAEELIQAVDALEAAISRDA